MEYANTTEVAAAALRKIQGQATEKRINNLAKRIRIAVHQKGDPLGVDKNGIHICHKIIELQHKKTAYFLNVSECGGEYSLAIWE